VRRTIAEPAVEAHATEESGKKRIAELR